VGLKIEESDALIKFLLDHVEGSPDIHARVLWKPKTVVVWDVSFK
jgi:sulfonate dioxygenase